MEISEIRRLVFGAHHGYCWIPGCVRKATELHHRLHNTAVNRKLFPRFVNSIFNMVAMCESCHKGWWKEVFNVTEDMAMAYEGYLKEANCSCGTEKRRAKKG